jgi:cyanophycinase
MKSVTNFWRITEIAFAIIVSKNFKKRPEVMKIKSSKVIIFRSILVLFLLVTAVVSVVSQQRLLVIGGGERPAEAIRKFVEWGGGQKARILIITWATAQPEASFDGLKKDFSAYNVGMIEHAANRPLDAAKRGLFIEQLRTATALFFSGGDQNRIMDVLADQELLRLLREKYIAGTPFGGTSAGAAVMSDPMMTGEADLKILDGTKVGVRPALGLVPNIMFDQHFLVRQRHNRLFGFVMQNPKFLGVGIDENTAVMITGNRDLQVVGATQVMFVDAKGHKGSMVVNVLKDGDWFDIRKRKRIGRSSVKIGR